MGVLDDAIAGRQRRRRVGSRRDERILQRLAAAGMPAVDVDRLRSMLAGPVTEWGHVEMVDIVKACCADLGVDDEDTLAFNVKNVQAARG